MIPFIVLAQITSVIGWLLLIYSYYKEDIDKLLYIQIISSIFYCVSYIFLGAYSGFFVCFIELLKGIGYYKTDKDDLIFLLSLPIYLIMGICSYNSLVSLLPIVGSIIDGYSLTKNKTIATIGSIISNILWVIYDVIILAYATALTDSILVISNISLLLFGYSMILKSNKIRIIQCRNLSKNVYDAISELDKNNYGIEYVWPMSYEKELINKEKENLYLLKYHNETIGYINCLAINENEYLNILNSYQYSNEYDKNNVVSIQNRKKHYLVIDSINVKKQYNNEVTKNIIVKKIKNIIISNLSDGVKIESVIAVSLNKLETEVLEAIGFVMKKEYDKNKKIYILSKEKIESIFLQSSKNKNKYKILTDKEITQEMLQEINNLDKKYFKEEYTWPTEYQIEIYNKNPKSLLIVTYENKVIGYLNYLVLTKDKYEEMVNSDIAIDYFEINDISKFYRNRKNYITINSIVILKKHQNGIAIKKLLNKFKKELKTLNYNNFRISAINAIAISKDGNKVLKNLNFEMKKELKDGNNLYILEGEKLDKFLK